MMTAAAPTLAEFETMADLALRALPRRFRRELGGLMVRVAEFPDDETIAAMQLVSPYDLLGLYRGVALPLKSVFDPVPNVDMVFLYRRPILAYCAAAGEDPETVIRHVLIHEIGHHFGFSDDDMERIENLP